MQIHAGRVASIAIALSTALHAVAFAQSPQVASINANDFLERLDLHPRAELVRSQVGLARAAIVAVRMLPNPAVLYDREDVSVNGRWQPEDYLRATVPIDVSGRRGKRIQAAEAGANAAAATAERQRLLMHLQGLSLFYDVAYARLCAEVLQADREQLAAIVNRLRARAAAGDASGYDVTRIEIELGEHDDRLAQVDRELGVGRLWIGSLTGAVGPVDAADDLMLPVTHPMLTSGPDLRADLRAARERRAQGDAEATAGRRGWVPTLELSGGLKSIQQGTERFNGYLAGVALRLPLLDHGQAEEARGHAFAQVAAAEARALEVAVPIEISAARMEYERLWAHARAFADQQLPLAETLVRRAEGLYKEGARPIFELIDAHRTARQIRLRAVELRRQAKQAELDLWSASGKKP